MRFGTLDANIDGFWVVAHDSGELAVDTTTYSITGLDGDTDIEYQLIVRYVQPGDVNLLLNFNGDTGANYGKQFMYGRDTATAAIRFTGQGNIRITQSVSGASGYLAFSNSHIFAKSGKERTLLNHNAASITGTTIYNVEKSASVWNNTADNLVSMQFSQGSGDIKAGSRFILLKKVHASDGMKLGAARPNKLENAWERIYNKTLNSIASSVSIKDLEGDTDCIYRLVFRPVDYNTVGNYYLTFNGDTGSNYGWQYLYGSNASVAAARGSGTAFAINSTAATNRVGLTDILIYAKSGHQRTCLMEMNRDVNGTTISEIWLEGQTWNNSASEITSITITTQADQMNVGTTIELYRLNL